MASSSTRLVGAVRRAEACAATRLGAALRRARASSARQLADAALRRVGDAVRRRGCAEAVCQLGERVLVDAALRRAALRLAAALRRAMAAR
jgi:hypothetical protein